MSYYLIQAIGFAGVAMFILSYQIRSNKALYAFQAIGSLLFCIQFGLLGQLSGSLNLILVIIRNFMLTGCRKYPVLKKKIWPCMITVISIVGTIMTWKGLISLLPLAAVCGSTFLYWTDNAQKIRLSNLACASPCWLIYDLLIGSWGGVLNEAITLASILVSIKRFGWKEMAASDSSF